MKRLASTLFCVLVVLVACASAPVTLSPLPDKAYRITNIPTQYVEWWAEIERCSGKQKPLDGVQWYLVVNATDDGFPWRNPYKDNQVELVAGLAYSDISVIVMGTSWLFSPWHVRHEMLHLIASPTGHDPELYLRGACAHLVSCVGGCLRP